MGQSSRSACAPWALNVPQGLGLGRRAKDLKTRRSLLFFFMLLDQALSFQTSLVKGALKNHLENTTHPYKETLFSIGSHVI